MKKSLFLVVFAFICITISCKTDKKQEDPTEMEQVMEIHDEVMPKMGLVGKLVGQLKPMADSLGPDSKQALAMKDLQDANKAMMDWMQGFGDKFDSAEILGGQELSYEKQQLLAKEKEKMNTVKEAINSSIAKAKEILKK